MATPTKVYPVVTQGAQHKESLADDLRLVDKKIAVLETLHYDIGARLGKAKIKHLHVYNYADTVPLEVDHTLIPS